MRILIATVALLLALGSAASAGTICTSRGNTVQCRDTDTGQTTYCTTNGNTMRCFNF